MKNYDLSRSELIDQNDVPHDCPPKNDNQSPCLVQIATKTVLKTSPNHLKTLLQGWSQPSVHAEEQLWFWIAMLTNLGLESTHFNAEEQVWFGMAVEMEQVWCQNIGANVQPNCLNLIVLLNQKAPPLLTPPQNPQLRLAE